MGKPSTWIGTDNEIKSLFEISFPLISLLIYSAVTYLLWIQGFNYDGYK